MVIILKSATEISESSRNLDASVFSTTEPQITVITLSELASTENYQKIITKAKVLSRMEPMFVSGGKKKQDVIGDHTGTSKVTTLWEQHVDSLDVEHSYWLENFVVREYAS